MNLNKYNISKFNIPSGAGNDEINFSVDCHEQIVTTVTFSLNTLFDATGSESLNNFVVGTAGIKFGFGLETELGSSVTAELIAVIKGSLEEKLQVISNVVEDISVGLEGKEEISLSTYLSADSKFFVVGDERLLNSFFAGKDLTYNFFANEELILGVRTSLLNDLLFSLNISLRPGETVEIDSDVFTAYLNDQNVIDLYSGEWITISRDSMELNVSSGSGGNLAGLLIYRERYL